MPTLDFLKKYITCIPCCYSGMSFKP